jgi:heat shock protein HtpX
MAARPATFGRDRRLTARMTTTIFLLELLYVVFAVVLFQFTSAWFAIVICAVLLGFQYFGSEKMALRAAGARVVSEQDAPELHAMIQRLCMTAGLPMPRVAIAPTDMPNAFATGRSPKHSAVAVTEGLLRRLTPEELEGVLAHELAHVKHRDVAVMTLASFFAMVAGLLVQWGPWIGLGNDRDRNGGNAFIVVFMVSIAVYVLSFFLIRALSRYREFAADRGATVLTKNPSGLASALMKISGSMARIPTRDLRTAESMNQFYIIPAHIKGSLSGLFSTHPPVEARLEQLRRLERQLETI